MDMSLMWGEVTWPLFNQGRETFERENGKVMDGCLRDVRASMQKIYCNITTKRWKSMHKIGLAFCNVQTKKCVIGQEYLREIEKILVQFLIKTIQFVPIALDIVIFRGLQPEIQIGQGIEPARHLYHWKVQFSGKSLWWVLVSKPHWNLFP